MAKSRGFTLSAVLTLALGIGANAAIFSVVNAVLVRPLPFADSDRLLSIVGVRLNYDRYPFRIIDFLDYRERNRTFEQLAAYGSFSANLTSEAEPQRLQGVRATSNLFDMLGARAALGRTLLPEDDDPRKSKVAVLSYGLWKRQFGSDPNVIGRKITLSGDPFTVVGVLPREFVLPTPSVELIVPLAPDADPYRYDRSSISFLRVYGRLKRGVTIAQADQDLNRIARDLIREFPDKEDMSVRVIPLRDEIVGGVQLTLLVLVSAVGMVLLIACANMASLLLAKASARRRELAIRVALGGTRSRLIRQMLTESLVLALFGGALGAIFAAWGLDGLLALIPADLPRSAEIHVDARMFALALLLSVLSGLLFGLLPALEASAADVNAALRSEGRTTAGNLGRHRLRRVLVTGEVALSLVLLIAAGLLLKSFLRLRDVRPGFDARNVLSIRLALPAARYSNRDAVMELYNKLQPRLAGLAGVESVGATSIAPLSGPIASADFQVAGRPRVSGKNVPTAQYRMIAPDYFSAMRIPILRGRTFSQRDTAHSPLVAIVNDTVARSYWGSRNPVGDHILLEDDAASERDLEVVGVAGDIRLLDLESAPAPCVYVAMSQIPEPNARWIANNMFWMVRASSGTLPLAKAVRREVQAADPDIAASSIQPFDRYVVSATAARRFSLSLIGIFAAAALLLAASGVYALISYLVAQRTREIGVRIALGAQARNIFWQVAGEGVVLTSAGVAIGLAGAFGVTRLISSLLFGVTGHDAATMLGVAALLLATGVAASYFPARRAVLIDPLAALRED